MTQRRELFADDQIRPDRDNTDLPDYHLIRVYSKNSNVALEEKPDEDTLEKDLKHTEGVYWIGKDAGTDKEFASYFVVIHRKVDDEMEWNNFKLYLKVDQLWDPPTDFRKYHFQASTRATAGFIATAAKESFNQSSTIAKFFGHGVSEFKKKVGDKGAMEAYEKALNALAAAGANKSVVQPE
ncbi:MAG: hypothetical protein Q9199_007118 [Rusavskia elegans]